MKSKRRLLILCIVLLFISVICLCDAVIRMEAIMVEPQHINTFIPTEIPIQTINPTHEPIKKQKETAKPKLSNDDKYLLAKIAMAEAEGESEYGQRLVIDTILNRVDSSTFPDSVYGVLYQPYQFSSIRDGRFGRCYVKEELYDLVVEEVQNRTNHDVIFFRTGHYSEYGTPLFKEGAHYFNSL